MARALYQGAGTETITDVLPPCSPNKGNLEEFMATGDSTEEALREAMEGVEREGLYASAHAPTESECLAERDIEHEEMEKKLEAVNDRRTSQEKTAMEFIHPDRCPLIDVPPLQARSHITPALPPRPQARAAPPGPARATHLAKSMLGDIQILERPERTAQRAAKSPRTLPDTQLRQPHWHHMRIP